ncbi:energy transducer TonB [Shewanella gelidii]|uniref:Cell envelope biogenesis protein TonB n=1 Tax=Shewanella gelidii TaxID=1642821 RepID=A0A917JK22_9GAMM|nr:energy transducer TonB [Shewanella gelidii]MCL1097222.1 energy transducer TonB [Shewanella gelidii]GGI73419.1 cell envelope biogenesis protein TonB [Shewanella gelidii]
MFNLRITWVAPIIIGASSFICAADSQNQQAFDTSYQAYLTAIKKQDPALMVSSAATAYELGAAIYGSKSENAANLAMNWANALLEQPQISEADNTLAYELFSQVVKNREVRLGDDAVELVDPLLGGAESTRDDKEAKSMFYRAIDILEAAPEQKLLLADVKMAAFHRLKQTPQYDKSVSDGVLAALKVYQQQLPENSKIRLEATFNAGLIQFANAQESEAIALFETVVEQFDTLTYDHPYELAAHAKLVALYSKEGEVEKSTQHCVAIGRMKPWANTQEQIPLYRKPPVWPKQYIKKHKEGSVELSFTIDEQGFVTNPEILSVKGGRKFGNASIKALSEWRYAPKFENGKPVKTKSKVRLDYSFATK